MCSVEKLTLRSRAIFKAILFCPRHTFIVFFEKKKVLKKEKPHESSTVRSHLFPIKNGQDQMFFTTFQNLIIFRMVGVFFILFLHKTTLTWFNIRFPHRFGHFEIQPQNGSFFKFALLLPLQNNNVGTFQSPLIFRMLWMCFFFLCVCVFGTLKFGP